MNATEQARFEKMKNRIVDLRERLKLAKAAKASARAGASTSSRRVQGAMIAEAANGNGGTSRRRKPAANLKGTRGRARTRSAGKGATTASV